MVNSELFSVTTAVISFTARILGAVYILFKTQILRFKKKAMNAVIPPIYVLIASAVCVVIDHFDQSAATIATLLVVILMFFVVNKKLTLNDIFTSTLCIGIVYSLSLVSTILCGCITYLISFTDQPILVLALLELVGLALVFVMFKSKRIRRGFTILHNTKNVGFGLFSSCLIELLMLLFSRLEMSRTFKSAIIIFVLLLLAGLFIWIRKSITDHYKNKLQERTNEYYEEIIAEKDTQIEELQRSNFFLSKTVHRDNHLMSALQSTIRDYSESKEKDERETLLSEIQTLISERNDLLLTEQKSSKVLTSTGIRLIDGAIGNLFIKASAHNIEFDLIVGRDLNYLVNHVISLTDLETLLCDHIKDAIIAVDSNENVRGRILISISASDDIYEISIKDNGIDFEPDTLAKLGTERITTHRDEGGSGIGFMTTFETLRKSNAGLIITEFENKTPFSKSVTFRFDGSQSFIINSYRADELKAHTDRNDITFIKR